VSGFLGEQFALPVALESLRAQRKIQPSGEIISVAAADPLNLVGILVPGERVAAGSGKIVTFRDGVASASSSVPSVVEITAASGAAS
jgi:ATP-dependent Lhr-like helicase